MYPLVYNGSKEMDFLEYEKMWPVELLKQYGDLSEQRVSSETFVG